MSVNTNAKVPYSFDFLQTIIGVSWNATYLLLEYGGDNHPFISPPHDMVLLPDIRCSFPHEAGGTPGIRLNNNLTPRAGSIRTPFKLTSKILETGVKADAGLGFSGYGGYSTIPLSGDGPSLYSGVLLGTGALNPPFLLRVETGDSLPCLPVFRIALLKKASPPALVGTQPMDGTSSAISPVQPAGSTIIQSSFYFLGPNLTLDFSVDPPKGTITPL